MSFNVRRLLMSCISRPLPSVDYRWRVIASADDLLSEIGVCLGHTKI